MVRAFKVINEFNDELLIELMRPEKSGFVVQSITGLGPVKASINTTEIATSDGSVVNSARLSSRNIVIDLKYYEIRPRFGRASSYDFASAHKDVDSSAEREDPYLSIEDLRQMSYKYFPVKKPITLIFYTDNHTVYINGYVEANDPDIFSYNEGTSISIICPYPYFRALNIDETVNFTSVEPKFQFEFFNEFSGSVPKPTLIMSEFLQIIEKNIYYEGDIQTGVIMEIILNGRIGDLTIRNNSSAEHFKLKADKIESIIGREISSGDRIIIDSLPREKHISYYTEDNEFNILGSMDRSSNWLTLSRGDNLYTYSSEFGQENISFEISYPILYEGI